ncbi:MAG: PIN domain-containing protein [Chloroflexi bacterium]|nr:PIN domain-containing protein [Chloroflexota bacterium]
MIFVDSSVWIAIIDETDRHHQEARESYIDVIQSTSPVVTSQFILAETYTHLRYSVGHHKAVHFHRLVIEAQEKKLLRISWADQTIFDAAWRMFEKYADQNFSFVDCTSFALMRAHKIKTAFAFDDDFRVMGFEVKP